MSGVGRGTTKGRTHERGHCQVCGDDRALDAMGNLFLHRNGWDTCPGSRRPPKEVTDAGPNAAPLG